MRHAAHGGHFRLSGPVKNDALGPARMCALLRVRDFLLWAAGTLASGSDAVPRPCCRTGPCGPTDLLRQGGRLLLAGRAIGGDRGGPPACADRQIPLRPCRRDAEGQRFAVNPERREGVRGQNRNLSLISVAERIQHRHSMTPGRLAAVKDRGCPQFWPLPSFLGRRTKSAPPTPAKRGDAALPRRPVTA